MIGLSYYRQIKDVTQRPEGSAQTMQTMQDLVTRWPTSEYVDDAKDKIRFANDQLAGKEMQIGRYYLERREYSPAINRFRTVVENYSRHAPCRGSAGPPDRELSGAGADRRRRRPPPPCSGTNYPDSPWYKDAFKLLQSKGSSRARMPGRGYPRPGS